MLELGKLHHPGNIVILRRFHFLTVTYKIMMITVYEKHTGMKWWKFKWGYRLLLSTTPNKQELRVTIEFSQNREHITKFEHDLKFIGKLPPSMKAKLEQKAITSLLHHFHHDKKIYNLKLNEEPHLPTTVHSWHCKSCA